jgi:DNA-binding NarL/FixJ family response regulator
MKTRKKILYVEDKETTRSSLVLALNLRGFDAQGAADVATSRDLVKQLGSEIDVMVLDIMLEDSQHPNVRGIDLGSEAREMLSECPPEFLIFSAHEESDYYEAALKLDVGVYLVQTRVRQDDVIRHIRS